MKTFDDSLRVQSAKEAVTEAIRDQIHRHALPAGARLQIDKLAAQFGVSRTPVRDSLWQLDAEGLVTVMPRSGVIVREITDEEVLDVYRIKGALEPLMALWAAQRGSEEDRRHFLDSADELGAVAATGDVSRYVELLEGRRAELLAMAGSSPLQATLSVIDGRVRLLRFRNLSQPGRLSRSAIQHQRIAEAIRDGDGEAAYESMRFHMQDAEQSVRRLLKTGVSSRGWSKDGADYKHQDDSGEKL